MKRNYIITKGSDLVNTSSTVRMLCRNMGWSYEYLVQELRGFSKGDKRDHKGYTIHCLKEAPNKARGVSFNK